MKKNDNTGMLSTFVGGTLWGINGVMGNYLFLNKNVTTPWLIPYRLILAGFLLLGYLYYKKGSKIFDILKNPSAIELAKIIVSVGLAQNLAAIKALVTTGIQKGHMKLQARTLALFSGAKDDEVDLVVNTILEKKLIINSENDWKREKYKFCNKKYFRRN